MNEEWLNDSHIGLLHDFICTDQEGNDQVQFFLQEESFKLMEGNLVRTRLLINESNKLVGFYSLFNNIIKINKNKRKELDIILPQGVKEIPAIRLYYIGVATKFQGLGYGDRLMASILYSCAVVSQISGCSLLTVESTENAVGFYE